MTTDSKRIKKGMQFRSIYADSNPLWKVIESRGRGTWLCEIVNEPIEISGKMYDSDWVGVQKAFLSQEILGSLGMDKMWAELGDKHDAFYASLTPGDTVHYNNGFDSFVRCEVVVRNGQNKLLPIALVGKWPQRDLAHRNQDGSIYYGLYASKVLRKPYGGTDNQDPVFNPNASNIYECEPRGNDPRKMTPMDLSVPPMTPEESILAAKWKTIGDIQNTISDNRDNPDAILEKIHGLLAKRRYVIKDTK